MKGCSTGTLTQKLVQLSLRYFISALISQNPADNEELFDNISLR